MPEITDQGAPSIDETRFFDEEHSPFDGSYLERPVSEHGTSIHPSDGLPQAYLWTPTFLMVAQHRPHA